MKLLAEKSDLTKALFKRAADALEYAAHNEAGQSFGSDRFEKEETQAWADALIIRSALKEGLLP